MPADGDGATSGSATSSGTSKIQLKTFDGDPEKWAKWHLNWVGYSGVMKWKDHLKPNHDTIAKDSEVQETISHHEPLNGKGSFADRHDL